MGSSVSGWGLPLAQLRASCIGGGSEPSYLAFVIRETNRERVRVLTGTRINQYTTQTTQGAMGNRHASLSDIHLFKSGGVFTREQLEEYQDCTFFTKKDILRLYKRFYGLNTGKVPSNMQGTRTSIVTLTYEEIEKMPELRENPFSRRICEVFSEDGLGNVTFDDFLDMFSVLSEMAPLDLKLKHAFRIYDFDGDDFIGKSDLIKVIRGLTRDELNDEEVDFIVDRVLEEADLDMDDRLSFPEFEHVVSRSPDFTRTFHIRL